MSSKPDHQSAAAWIYREEDWPHGMLCETCGQSFREGDVIQSLEALGMTEDGIPIQSGACCPRCFEAAA